MRSHELARILKVFSDVLYELPDKNIEAALNEILEILKGKKTPNKSETNFSKLNSRASDEAESDLPLEIPEELIKSLNTMSLQDVRQLLDSDPQWKKTAALRALANRLDIEISSRQNRSAITHTILKHLERARLDTTIRSRSQYDKVNEIQDENPDSLKK